MSFKPCEYELIPPRPTEPAPDSELLHPDAAVTARAMTLGWLRGHRRFVFFETLRTGTANDHCAVFPVYHGFHNCDDGSVVILKGGQPVGWYSSIASAWHRLRSKNGLYVAWLEADATTARVTSTGAEPEVDRGPECTWYLTTPYTAYGSDDARRRAVDISLHLQSRLPDLDCLDVTYRLGGELETEAHVFCEAPGCLLTPGHEEAHQPDFNPAPVENDAPRTNQ